MNLIAMRRAVRESLADWYEFSAERGPCWPVARAIANAGVGMVQYCFVYCKTDRQWYGHFVVRTPQGTIVDASGEYVCEECSADRNAPYKHFRTEDSPDHHAYKAGAVEFWAERLESYLYEQIRR